MFSAASLLFTRRTADPVAALLSLSFLCLCIGSGPALDFFSGGLELSEVSLASRAVGFCAFFLAVSVFPHGRFEPRWSVWGGGYGGSSTTDGNATTYPAPVSTFARMLNVSSKYSS